MLTILLAVVAVAVIVTLVAAVAFDRRISRETDALLGDLRRGPAKTIEARDLEALPDPVRRWLRYSRVIGTTRPASVRLRQHGDFDQGRGWMPFDPTQYFTIDPPGFLWRASFRMAPLISVVGRDQYRGGSASMDMRLLSLVPVAKKTGGGLDQGDLLRFLGETQWFPGAALSEYIAWEGVDANSARATMSYGGVSASMTFIFANDGRLMEERAVRYNDARGRNEEWVNRNDVDRDFEGLVLPAAGEARWEYASGPFPYIRWTITAIERDRPVRFGR
jgi:hypothetical protein